MAGRRFFYPGFQSIPSEKLFKSLTKILLRLPPCPLCHHLFPRNFNKSAKFRNGLLPSEPMVSRRSVLQNSPRPGLSLCFKSPVNGVITGLRTSFIPQGTFPRPQTTCLGDLSRFPSWMSSLHTFKQLLIIKQFYEYLMKIYPITQP